MKKLKWKNKKYAVAAAGIAAAVTLSACSMIPTAKASYISLDAAQSAALSAANIAAADADIASTKLEENHGMTCYEVKFVSDGTEYEYTVNAESGEIVESSKQPVEAAGSMDQDTPAPDVPAQDVGTQDAATLPAGTEQQPVVTEPTAPAANTSNQSGAAAATTKPAATAPATNGQITVEKAKEIALGHAGLSADAVTFVKAKQDYENGKLVYEVEFVAGSGNSFMEYDYEIDAATGTVVSYDYDAENYTPQSGNTASGATIDEATAKQTALNKVSGATTANIYEWKLDYDDGRWEYEGKIIYNSMEYEFTIDATTGAVTEWDVESIYR